MISPLLNPAESSVANSAPPVNQQPLALPAVFQAARDSLGLGDVADKIIGSIPGAGLLNAVSSPMPSLTANVRADPAVTYGDRYIQNTIGANKNGGITVQSGNASNRQLPVGGSLVWWIVAAVAVGGFLLWRQRG